MNEFTIIYQTKEGEKSFSLSNVVTSIGSASQNDIVLQDKKVADVHGQIVLTSAGANLKGVSKKWKIIHNGQGITESILKPGDTFQIGETVVRFERAVPNTLVQGEESQIQSQLANYQMLLEAIECFTAEKNLAKALDLMLAFAVTSLHCNRGIIFEQKEDGFVPKLRFPPVIDENQTSAKWSRTIVRRVALEKKCMLVDNIDDESSFRNQVSIFQATIKSLLAGPLQRKNGDIVGVMVVDLLGLPRSFSQTEFNLFETIIRIASVLFDDALANKEKQNQLETLRNQIDLLQGKNLLCASAVMTEIVEKAKKYARVNVNILITGETGTGKELVARMVHQNSDRSGKPFVAINCAAIPENLLESEIFGYEKGAFTGANAAKTGLLKSADGGSFFLDEIGDLPLLLQAKLLRVLQEGTFIPVGSTREQKVDIRFIAATHRNLKEMAGQGTFRSDLLFRLNVAQLEIPPLRLRDQDPILLANFFIHKYTNEFFQSGNRRFYLTKAAEKALLAAPWPGNVRELENCIQRALLGCNGDAIGPDLLGLQNETGDVFSLKQARKDADVIAISSALKKSGNNLTMTAEMLGIDRKNLRELMKKYDMYEPPD